MKALVRVANLKATTSNTLPEDVSQPDSEAVSDTGGLKIVSLDTNHPEPTPSSFPDRYIVRTKAAALTRGELTWPEPMIPEIPIPGFDLAGIVTHMPISPKKSNAFRPGDEVYALTNFSEQGNAREVTVAAEHELARKPQNLSWEEAAAVPLSALSAYQALFVHGKLASPSTKTGGTNAGKSVLITAASGGVGIWGVQLAHLAGVEVVATCGPSNIEFVKSLGADVVLDYTKTNVLDWVNQDNSAREFDVVLDCIGGETLGAAWQCTTSGGVVISVAQPPDGKKPTTGVKNGAKGVWFIVAANGSQLAEITELIEAGQARSVVDSVYKLEEFREAFQKLAEGHARGKVVLEMD